MISFFRLLEVTCRLFLLGVSSREVSFGPCHLSFAVLAAITPRASSGAIIIASLAFIRIFASWRRLAIANSHKDRRRAGCLLLIA